MQTSIDSRPLRGLFRTATIAALSVLAATAHAARVGGESRLRPPPCKASPSSPRNRRRTRARACGTARSPRSTRAASASRCRASGSSSSTASRSPRATAGPSARLAQGRRDDPLHCRRRNRGGCLAAVDLCALTALASRFKPRPGARGFTLVELMIVVAVVGLFAAVAVPRLPKFDSKGRSRRRTHGARDDGAADGALCHRARLDRLQHRAPQRYERARTSSPRRGARTATTCSRSRGQDGDCFHNARCTAGCPVERPVCDLHHRRARRARPHRLDARRRQLLVARPVTDLSSRGPSRGRPRAMTDTTKTTGLVLTGGGARAAYRVGVLKAVAQIRRQTDAPKRKPVPGDRRHVGRRDQRGRAGVPCRHFDAAVDGLVHVWENFRAEQVYRPIRSA